MSSPLIRVAVNGYGVIGTRVADVAHDYRIASARRLSYDVFAGVPEVCAAMVDVGIDAQGGLDDLLATFLVTDGLVSYPVRNFGAPPDLFQENVGVVIEGHFEGETFVSHNVLVRHSEVYEAEAGEIDSANCVNHSSES